MEDQYEDEGARRRLRTNTKMKEQDEDVFRCAFVFVRINNKCVFLCVRTPTNSYEHTRTHENTWTHTDTDEYTRTHMNTQEHTRIPTYAK